MRQINFGHSYCLRVNRSIERHICEQGDDQIQVVCPNKWPGDLRHLVVEPEAPYSKLEVRGIPVFLSKKVQLFNYSKKQVRELTRSGWSGAYIWQEPYCRSALLLAGELKSQKIPYIFFTAQNIQKNYPWPFSKWEGEVVSNAAGWIACGKSVWEAQVSRGYPKDRGIILPHAVDTSCFKPLSDHEKGIIRSKWKLDGPIIGYVGRFIPEKGIHVLLKAIEMVPRSSWGGVVFLGSGPLEGVIRDWAQRLGINKKVFVGLANHNDVPEYMGSLDLIVAPSQTAKNWREQFGRMLIEAMASGVPIITSDSGEIPYTVGDAGIVLPESDFWEFGQAIQKLLSDSAMRSGLINRGLKRAKYYSVVELSNKYSEFWRRSFSIDK